MRGSRAAELEDLTKILKRAQEARVQGIVAEENRLRRAIAELDDKATLAGQLPAERLHDMRSVGADLLWNGWLSRSRRQLNIELAQVLARKGQIMREVRKAHGRNSAAKTILRHEEDAEKSKRQAALAEKVQLLSVLKAWERPRA
jgi:hypothetical protein